MVRGCLSQPVKKSLKLCQVNSDKNHCTYNCAVILLL